MISIDINPNVLSQLQQNSDTTKKMAKILKRKLIRYSKKSLKQERIKIQKELLQCLLPALLEIITKDEEILKYLDLSEVSFAGMDVKGKNFKDSNANIDPQTIKDKTLFYTNLKGIDLSHADFYNVNLIGANLENTGAQIDPQLIYDKCLYNTNVKGCTLINLSSLDSLKRQPADFTNVNIENANLENTNALIDPQLIKDKSLHGANVKGCTLINLSSSDTVKREPADFTGVDIERANLENTGAQIDPQRIKRKDLYCTNVKGCTFINQSSLDSMKTEPADFTDVILMNANLEDTGAQIDPQLITRKALFDANLKGLDLSHADFTDVAIQGTNLEGTGAIINPHTVYGKIISGANLNYCTLIDNGKLKGIRYNQHTSLKYAKFSTFVPYFYRHDIDQDITEYILPIYNPITTIQKTLNKVFKR